MASLEPTTAQHSTRATYRSLLLRGFGPGEAANLTAYLAGIAIDANRPWRADQVERLLFLRELCRGGRIGLDDGLGDDLGEGPGEGPATVGIPARAEAPATIEDPGSAATRP